MVFDMAHIKSLEWENKILINTNAGPLIQQKLGGIICTLTRRDALRK